MKNILILSAAAVALAPPVPASAPVCACTKQLSKAACVEGKTFGCLPDGTMWTVRVSRFGAKLPPEPGTIAAAAANLGIIEMMVAKDEMVREVEIQR